MSPMDSDDNGVSVEFHQLQQKYHSGGGDDSGGGSLGSKVHSRNLRTFHSILLNLKLL